MGKVTVLSRRKVAELPEQYGVDLAGEETEGRLVQHIEGLNSDNYIYFSEPLFYWSCCVPDLDAVSDETVKQLCTGGHVFFNCLGTTRSQAGSAVSSIQ